MKNWKQICVGVGVAMALAVPAWAQTDSGDSLGSSGESATQDQSVQPSQVPSAQDDLFGSEATGVSPTQIPGESYGPSATSGVSPTQIPGANDWMDGGAGTMGPDMDSGRSIPGQP